MVVCCVPRCNAGRKPDPAISFHAFPSNPDMAAKWIRNINLFIPNGGTWFPQAGNIVVCSKHFLQSDFRPELKTPTLKHRSVPTIFEKTVSPNPSSVVTSGVKRKKLEPKSPLIVKVVKPAEDIDDTEMDDAPLTELLRESLHASSSSSLSAPSSSSSLSFTPTSSTSFCISQVTSLAEPYASSGQPTNSNIPRDSGTAVAESAAVYGETEPVTLHEDEPCAEGGDISDSANKQKNELPSKRPKMTVSRPKKNESTDLIEIGPSTFLKINPDVIKVTKKVTPSGNTVLQFVMNPNLGLDPKSIFQPVMKADSSVTSPKKFPNSSNFSSAFDQVSNMNTEKVSDSSSNVADKKNLSPDKTASAVSSATLSSNLIQLVESDNVHIAPVVLSTNLPVNRAISYSYSMQQKHANSLRQKNRQIQSLKAKVDKLLKKVDELETKCIVQERQLDFPSLKKLRSIKKNADKGEPHANFILEQIRGYFGNNPLRWSDSTMTQCSVWCRKAPYAYEYFKKADLFRLPCLGTVKRYMKKHPEITTQIRNRTLGVHTLDSGDSSSDFDFDEDDDVPNDENSVNSANQIACETILTVPSNYTSEDSQAMIVPDAPSKTSGDSFPMSEPANFAFSTSANLVDNAQNSEKSPMLNSDDSGNTPITCEDNQDVGADEVVSSNVEAPVPDSENDQLSMEDAAKSNPDDIVKNVYLPTNQDGGITTMNLNGQEIILQPGNVIHLNSNIDGCEGIENQYFVIPAAATDDQSASGDHQYSSVAQPLSFVIQNGGEEQVIYITEDTSSASETVAVSLTE